MIILQASFLGILQTFTEIFPFSNTGHIILLQNLFGYKKSYPAYDVMIDCGTMFALFVFFAKDILKILKQAPRVLSWPFRKDRDSLFLEYPYALLFSYLMISTLVTSFVRIAFFDAGNAASRWQAAIGTAWVLMGLLIFMTRRFQDGFRSIYEMNHQDAFVIGLVQGLTLFPGISRIGITFLTAMLLGIERKEAARYSFLLGLPYIICAIIYKFSLGPHFFDSDQTALFMAFLFSAASGVIILAFAMRIIQRGLWYFTGFYCAAIGIFAVLQSLLKSVFS